MKILFQSYAFAPSVGGIEIVSEILANEWVREGHEVILVTSTHSGQTNGFPYKVYRRPDLKTLIEIMRWSDIIFQNNISLSLLWPNILVGRPTVVTVQTWIGSSSGSRNLMEKIKAQLHRLCTCITISEAVTEHLPVSSTVVANPYNDDIFKINSDIARTCDLIFVGRLVSDKGLGLLLESLSGLQKLNIRVNLTVVGDGPEMNAHVSQCKMLSLREQVEFVGVKKGIELCDLLNAHRILVVPSLWAEPFGIVALEGIACGCVVVGSKDGGLRETIGPCGLLFPNGNCDALIDCLRGLLTNPDQIDTLSANRGDHLGKFKKSYIAKRYIEIFENLLT